jgi:S-layer homology domain
MKELGITAGCSPTQYCPDDPVTRGQMAVFLIRAVLGITAQDTPPSPATPFFTDVPAAHPFFSFIQKMRELGITSGCTATTYRPDAPATRGQMAVFLIRAFFTPPFAP